MSDGVKVTITMTEGSLFVISTILDKEADKAVTDDYRMMLKELARNIRVAIITTPGAVIPLTPR